MAMDFKIPSSSQSGFRLLRRFVHVCFIRVLVILFSGVLVESREKIPVNGPAVLAVNHNSHADTVLLQSLFSFRDCYMVRPGGAADYFFRNRFISALSSKCLGIVPIVRTRNDAEGEPLELIYRVLSEGDIVIVFPEGTRSITGEIGRIRGGVIQIHDHFPDVPIIPIHLDGTARLLPKGSYFPTPFLVRVTVGDPVDCSLDIKDQIEQFFHTHDETPADDLYF